MSDGYYFAGMRTVTIKVTEEQYARLASEAKSRGVSRSALVRRLLDDAKGSGKYTLYDVMKPFIGTASGPTDLSTNKKHMTGYGDPHSNRHRAAGRNTK